MENKKPRTRRMLTVASRQASMNKLRLMARVRDLLVEQPQMTQTEMAVVIGVKQPTISTYIRQIYDAMLEEFPETVKEKVGLAITRNMRGAGEAYKAWVRSQKNAEQITTEYIPKTCPICSGKINGKPCKACDGTGRVLEELVTRTEKGQVGDPSMLKEYREFLREAHRLQGLYARLNRRKDNPMDGAGVQVHLHTDYDFSRLSGEDLLRLKNAMDLARIAGPKTIDVNSSSEQS